MLYWLISDGKHFRLERPPNNKTNGIKNLFITDIDQPVISDILESKFEKGGLNRNRLNHDEFNSFYSTCKLTVQINQTY